jgi:beta-lactamase superfamily II metal-dependent hydrolase
MPVRSVCTGLLLLLLALPVTAAHDLDIYFIDVEGGQATLVVTPAGESLLIDAGYAGAGQRGSPPRPPGSKTGRDAARVLDTIRAAGLGHLDYLLVTHFHPDHVGAVPDLASQIRIDTFIDYGMPLGFDRMAANSFRGYEPVRAEARHIEAHPGDHLPLKGLETTIVSAGGELISQPLGAGEANKACVNVEDQVEDGTENYRSVGVVFRYGAFRFLDLGDLSGNTLTSLACPRNMLERVSVYLVAHHGDYDTSVPALYAALRPRVAIMNNGVMHGGAPEGFRTIRGEPSIEDLWQLHAPRTPTTASSQMSTMGR